MNLRKLSLSLLTFSFALSLLMAEKGAPKGPPATPVKASKVESGPIQNRKVVTGIIVAPVRSSLSPQVGGSVVEILVEEGARVKKGDALLKLDPRRAKQELKINLQLQKVNKSEIKSNESILKLHQDDVKDIKSALSSFPGSISQKELRQANTTVVRIEGELETLKAEGERLKTQEQRLTIDLNDHLLTAPFSGVIIEKAVEIGSRILVGQKVVTLLNPKKLQVELNCPESMASVEPKVLADSLVYLSVNRSPLTLYNYRLSPSLDPRSKTFKVIADLREIPPGAMDGASVIGEVAIGSTTNRIWIPGDAVLKNEVGPYVYKVQKGPMGTIALPVPVHILYRVGSQTVINPGSLAQGDQVITEGNERLFPNMPVKVLEGNK